MISNTFSKALGFSLAFASGLALANPAARSVSSPGRNIATAPLGSPALRGAGAPNTVLTPTPSGSWMAGAHPRGLTVSAFPSGAASGSIGFAQFRNEMDSLRFDLNFSVSKPSPGDSTLGFGLGFGYRIYRLVSGNLKAFTQPGAEFGKAATTGGFGDDMYLAFNYRIGAEYYFNPNLAIGMMTGLELAFRNGFDLLQIGTGTSAVFMSWYW
jgi:hypothetical protein